MGALTAGLQNSEDRIAERKIDYTVTNGTDDAGEIPPEPQWKLRLLVLPEAYLPVGGIEARGEHVDDHFAWRGHGIGQVAINQDFRPAKSFDVDSLHQRTVSSRFDVNRLRATSALTGSPKA